MNHDTKIRVGDFYTEVVLPALAERLEGVFPEFGWRRDSRGWVATNEEMTHRVLGVRADRVVAHGPAPRGFLIHGGDATLWTAYVNGGSVPKGEEFARVVKEIAERAGVDTSPVERRVERDRRVDLLHDFFSLCRWELAGEAGRRARDYLKERGLPADRIERCGLGVVPDAPWAKDALRAAGYSDQEISQSSVLYDKRWPGRLCGAWRDEWGRIRTLWARDLDASGPADSRYLYLRGANRSGLPPYGLSWIVKQTPRPRELVLVEGLLDVHHLRARGIANVAALGGTGVRPQAFERLARLGFESVTLCLDRDVAGRTATARAVEQAAQAPRSPAILVVDPERLEPAKDPDALVGERGVEAWLAVINTRTCGFVWRALEFAADVQPDSAVHERRAALARAGGWLGALSPRLALEQEDAVRAVAESSGYSPEAVTRSFRARFWSEPAHELSTHRSRAADMARHL
jgi:hypothetical protein